MESPRKEPSLEHARYLGARDSAEFFGRADVLATLQSLAADALRGGVRGFALDGPCGSGKSELLRQFALAPTHREARLTPLYLNLGSLAPFGGGEERWAEAVWPMIFSSVVRQVLLHRSRGGLSDPMWGDPESGRLVEVCYGAGLGELAPFVSQSNMEGGGCFLWRELLGLIIELLPDPPVLLIDGMRQAEGLSGLWLGDLIADTLRCGCSVVFEMPESDSQRLALPTDDLEVLDLKPLTQQEAVSLVNVIAQKRGWVIAPHLFLPVLPRLGPWPGWVRGWAGMVRPSSEIKPVRVVEKAYVDFIASSTWARRLRDRFAHLIGRRRHEASLRLALATLQRRSPISIAEATALLNTQPQESEKILTHLGQLGLIKSQGMRWQAPDEQAPIDWMRLALAEARDPLGREGARVDMLVRLLALPHPESATGKASDPVDLDLFGVMKRFSLQMIPYVLLNYGDYYEAVGRLGFEDRREMVCRSTATVHLPEVIGVAGWQSTLKSPSVPRLYYARGYREGKYLTCNEEIWIMADLSEIRTLTTPELDAALVGIDALKEQLGEGARRVWLIIGETASDEALDLIRQERIHCSNLEQVGMLSQLLTPAPPRRPPNHKPKESTPEPGAFRERRSVIEMATVAAGQAVETSSIKIPAREGSEIIAALMAEKLAIRGRFEAAQAGHIKTSVLEGVLNAIEHSPNPEKLIEVTYALKSEQFEITIDNEGVPFSSAGTPVPDPIAKLKQINKRGWGINLMKRFMDKVEYEPRANGTRLRLIKHRAATANQRVQTLKASEARPGR